MEDSVIIRCLKNFGYLGSKLEVQEFEFLLASEESATVVQLSKVIHFLSEKLYSVSNIEERVNIINNSSEINMLCMELSGLLRELYCPYSALMGGPPQKRLCSRGNRLKLLNFLISECQAAMMINVEDHRKKAAKHIDETATARDLKSILTTMGFGKPPADVTAQQLFMKINDRVREVSQKQPSGFPGEPLLKTTLTKDQWHKLQELHTELVKDYKLRREMLLTRLDVTILSFTWSSNLKSNVDDVSAVYQPQRLELACQPSVRISHILSARESLGHVEKTSSAAVREKTQTPLQKLVIGQVPDRGGRPAEHTAPLPEMPGWQKRNPSVGQGNFRGTNRGRGGFSRGRVQGGWNQAGTSWNSEQKSHWRGRGRGNRN